MRRGLLASGFQKLVREPFEITQIREAARVVTGRAGA
jgi:hypothetical protein